MNPSPATSSPAEHSFAKFNAIESGYRSLLVPEGEVLSKCREYLFEGAGSWFNGCARKDVSIYDWKMVFLLKESGDRGLACGNASCQTDNQHRVLKQDGPAEGFAHTARSVQGWG